MMAAKLREPEEEGGGGDDGDEATPDDEEEMVEVPEGQEEEAPEVDYVDGDGSGESRKCDMTLLSSNIS